MRGGERSLLNRSRLHTLLRFAAGTGSEPVGFRATVRPYRLGRARILVADFSRRLSPGGRVGHVPPTLGLMVPRATARAAWRCASAWTRGRRSTFGIVAVSWPCIAGPARMLATTDTRWVSSDRPDGAPLMRFRPLQRSPATPRLIMVQPCHGSGRCRFGVRRPAPAPRVSPALPRPIRSPMRFFAHRPRWDSRPESAGVPVNRGQRRNGSCAASSFVGGDVPLPAPNRVARPGLSFVSRRRSWGSSLRSVAPARAASGASSAPSCPTCRFAIRAAPIIFVGGSAVPLGIDLDLLTHVISGDS